MAPLLSSLANTIKSLNNVISISDGVGSEGTAVACGTYALINRIINDLASLKTTLKDAEKQMEIMLVNELLSASDQATQKPNAHVVATGVTHHGSTLAVANRKIGVISTAFTTTPDIPAFTAVRGGDSTAVGNNVGIKLGAADNALTEAAIMNTLADVYKLVKCLSNGSLVPASVGTTST